eukprot:TRINITY_DN67327_c3_g4_i1.p1 TRINITY_DN67327_c3_g4~~TRINITY_DN67327_c3_g4_i1.p1  ORF type:complete len:785 (-),score=106.44 TRINITY_DN67327_c3_g4_i1:1377-3731(-)
MTAKVLVPTAAIILLGVIFVAILRPRSHKISSTNALSLEEEYFVTIPSFASANSTMFNYTREQHQAGTSGAAKMAQTIRQKFLAAGLNTTVESFNVLLSYVDKAPDSRIISFNDAQGQQVQLNLQEDGQADCGSDCAPTYLGFSNSGDVTAPIVYVNYGRPEDYKVLQQQGVDVKDKIAFIRYGKMNRGTKVRTAAENGAVGAILFSDPYDDSDGSSAAFPDGPGRPADGVQRGSILDISEFAGDALSPGWPSLDEEARLDAADRWGLPTIPGLPISSKEANKIMANIGGTQVPEDWKGDLPAVYKFGDSLQVRLKVKMADKQVQINDVVGKVVGSEQPDRYVLMGCHYDSWVKGAVDPGTGLATLLETVRGFGGLIGAGWRPKRTIIFVSWDAEEQGLIGSSEWVEKHRHTLYSRAVAYFNLDVVVSAGAEEQVFSPTSSPVLSEFILEVARQIPLEMPKYEFYEIAGYSVDMPFVTKGGVEGPSVFTTSLETLRNATGKTSMEVPQLGSGSDYTPFQQHIGIASADLRFYAPKTNRTYGQYHSIYDNWELVSKFVAMKYIPVVARLLGVMAMRMGSTSLLPHNYTTFSDRIQQDLVIELKGRNVDKDYPEAYQRLEKAAKRLGSAYRALMSDPAVMPLWEGGSTALVSVLKNYFGKVEIQPSYLRAVNDALMQAERALTDPDGLPGRTWYKYQMCAPGLYQGYGEQVFPAVVEAVQRKDTKAVKVALQKLASGIFGAARILEETMYLSPNFDGVEGTDDEEPAPPPQEPAEQPNSDAPPETE